MTNPSHCPWGERITRVEARFDAEVPGLKEDIGELKGEIRALSGKMDKFIDGLAAKADRKDMDMLQRKASWLSGIFAVIAFLGGLFGKKWFGLE